MEGSNGMLLVLIMMVIVVCVLGVFIKNQREKVYAQGLTAEDILALTVYDIVDLDDMDTWNVPLERARSILKAQKELDLCLKASICPICGEDLDEVTINDADYKLCAPCSRRTKGDYL